MSRRASPSRAPLARCAALVVGLALVACRDEADPRPPAVRTTIRIDGKRALGDLADPARPRWAMDGTWVVQETRTAHAGTWDRPMTFPIAVSGDLAVTAAFATEAGPLEDRDDVRVVYELRLRAPGRDELLATVQDTLHDSAHTWREVRARARVAPSERAELAVVARQIGNVASGSKARPLFAVPTAVERSGERRNVLIVSVDTLRADHLGFHGYARPTSPHLDALVAGGAVFEHAISTSPWTLPSYGTLFTGLEPARHRAGISARREAAFGQDRDEVSGDYQALAGDAATMAELFAAQGYATAAFVSNPYLDPGSGIDRGFGTFAQYLNRAAAGVELATRWIREHDDQPWFVFLHLMDPHTPYTPPPPYGTRFAGREFAAVEGWPPSIDVLRAQAPDPALKSLLVDFYDGEIAYTDEQIGRLLRDIGFPAQRERTIVVFHSDHGEEFWEHGLFEHGHALFEESLHVPLAFVAPGLVPAGTRVAPRISTVDVFPTVLELAGIPVPGGLDGRSLVPAWAAEPSGAALEPRACLSEATLYGPRELKSWSRSDEKLVTDGAARSLLFDLATDPLEQHDVSAANAARVQALRELFRARAERTQHAAAAGAGAAFDRERRAELERLGYPGGEPK